MKIRSKSLMFVWILVLSILIIPNVLAKVSDLKFEVDPFQYDNNEFKPWSSDMKKIGITTEERGLIYRITISNEEDVPITVDELVIQVRAEKTDGKSNTIFEEAKNYVYLPPNGKKEIDIPLDFGYGEIIGSYKAEIQYGEGSYVSQNLESYPSNFRVLSEDLFQKEIEQKKDSPLIDIDVENLTIFDFGLTFTLASASVVLIWWYYKRRH